MIVGLWEMINILLLSLFNNDIFIVIITVTVIVIDIVIVIVIVIQIYSVLLESSSKSSAKVTGEIIY